MPIEKFTYTKTAKGRVYSDVVRAWNKFCLPSVCGSVECAGKGVKNPLDIGLFFHDIANECYVLYDQDGEDAPEYPSICVYSLPCKECGTCTRTYLGFDDEEKYDAFLRVVMDSFNIAYDAFINGFLDAVEESANLEIGIENLVPPEELEFK